MTTIAFDGLVLAADSASIIGNTLYTTLKIHITRNGDLLAGTGDRGAVDLMVEWIENGCVPADRPPGQASEEDGACNVLHVSPTGLALLHTRHGATQVHPPIAIGSGSQFALAAMHLGSSAPQAAHLATQLDPYSRGPVNAVRLDGEKWTE